MTLFFLAYPLLRKPGEWEKRGNGCFPTFLAPGIYLPSVAILTGVLFNIFHCDFPQLLSLLPQTLISCLTHSVIPTAVLTQVGPHLWEGNICQYFLCSASAG